MNIYIHIPFCKTKCPYCGFFSCVNNEVQFESYFKRLEEEISYYSPQFRNDIVDSIYIGGGTPNFVPSTYIVSVLNSIKNSFQLDSNIEISIEMNPEYIEEEMLNNYRKAGINRVSIGLQSTHNHHLCSLGRRYTYEKFLKKYSLVKNAGFENIGIDLIFGFPNLTFQEWKDTLSEISKLDIQHISCYSLEVEENTLYGKLINENRLDLPTDEIDRKMYHYTNTFLKQKDFFQYEISNYSKKGYECKHNVEFWNYMDYVGLGAGAYSRIGKRKISNIENIEEYIKGRLPNKENLSQKMIDLEKIILGLRLMAGIPYNPKYYIDEYMKKRNGMMYLNTKGKDLYNLVVQKIL